MMPAWMVIGLVAVNILQALGWAYTISKSMKRSLQMWEFGREAGVEQGRAESLGWKKLVSELLKKAVHHPREKTSTGVISEHWKLNWLDLNDLVSTARKLRRADFKREKR